MEGAENYEFGGEPPAHPAQPGDPHAPDQRVADRHRPAIGDPRRQEERSDILGECPDERIGLFHQPQAKIFEPADEDDIADDAGKAYVVGPYAQLLLAELVRPRTGS